MWLAVWLHAPLARMVGYERSLNAGRGVTTSITSGMSAELAAHVPRIVLQTLILFARCIDHILEGPIVPLPSHLIISLECQP